MAHETNQVGGRCGRPRGFTLIELLVVIAIIVILVGILVPTMAAARNVARKVDTTNEMAGLQTAITRYITDFNAPPGPISEGSIGSGLAFTGNQNLLIGLSRQFYWASPQASPATTSTVSITTNGGGAGSPAVTFCADPGNTSTPLDYSKLYPGTNTAGKPYDAYWAPRSGEVSKAGTYPGTSLNFPVIVDRFLDPLPILYFRATPGNDGSPTATVPPFNPHANDAFVASPCTSTNGVVYTQGAFASSVLYTSVGGSFVPLGAFVLISPGLDRHYGSGNDDIIMSGR